VVEDTSPLRFSVEKAKIKWGTYLRDALRGGSASSQFESYSGNAPSVVVQNARGEKRTLEVTSNLTEARARAADIESDYKTLSTLEWCRRYDVPASFLSG
jgi:hypothetical protein